MNHMKRWMFSLGGSCLMIGGLLSCQQQTSHSVQAPSAEPTAQLASSRSGAVPHVGNIETVAYFEKQMPTGVTVSHTGRIFVCYPRWGDPVDFTVAEIKNGQAVAYPGAAYNRFNPIAPGESLVSVQSVVIDPNDRLWILDTGAPHMGATISGGPKLVGVDLNTNKVFKTIQFPPNVVLSTSYLNDVRFDLRRSLAFITDSSSKGPNGIIVVNLDSEKSWRRLNDHPSTKADKNFTPVVEGEPLLLRSALTASGHVDMGADGIAISNDGKALYYCPLISRHLYAVSTDALADQSKSDAEVAATVQDLGDRGFASDGLETDAQGRIYLTDYEHNGIQAREPDGSYHYVARSSHIIWPDTLCVANNGYLYFTNNQLNRMSRYHNGKDQRQPPYTLNRVKIDGTPVMLK